MLNTLSFMLLTLTVSCTVLFFVIRRFACHYLPEHVHRSALKALLAASKYCFILLFCIESCIVFLHMTARETVLAHVGDSRLEDPELNGGVSGRSSYAFNFNDKTYFGRGAVEGIDDVLEVVFNRFCPEVNHVKGSREYLSLLVILTIVGFSIISARHGEGGG